MSEDLFRWIITIGVLLAAIAFVSMGVAVVIISKQIKLLKEKVTPILDIARQVARDNGPNISGISQQAAGVAKMVREQVIPKVAEIAANASAISHTIGPKLNEIATQGIEISKYARATIAPKVAEIADHGAGIARVAREEVTPKISEIVGQGSRIASNVGSLVEDTTARVKSKVAQVDGAVGHTVEQVQHAGEAVKSAVKRPFVEVEGLFSGIRAGVSALTQGRRPSVEYATQDEEMFI